MTGVIEIISASAGSGKTWRLADELQRAVTSGDVRPEAVVAMTFTVKAAEELRRRVRTHLLKAGRESDAQRVTAARMGTVNSVCSRLISDFALDLGFPPELRVLEEETAQRALRESLSLAITDEAHDELADLASRLDVYRGYAFGPAGWDWQADIERVVTLARSNGIEAAALRRCAERSKEQMLSLLGAPSEADETPDARLRDALHSFLDALPSSADKTKKTADVVRRASPMYRRLCAGRALRWDDWAKLSVTTVAKKSKLAFAAVQDAASLYDRHPQLRRDVGRGVDLVFELAERVLDRYAEHKRALGVVDFADQEALALEILGRPEVQERLRSQIDLVLVDEFQDTSPIQLAIFLRLAGIAPRSVWVGDQKQAIYAFRGTDPQLMDAVIDDVLAGSEPETLPHSWRSRPALVELTSEVFAPAFSERGIPEGRVRLTPAHTEEPEGLGAVLECWRLDAVNADDDAASLAAAVGQLLHDETARVRDQITGEARALRPDDVAVLCRRNRTCVAVAAALEGRGVRCRLERPGLLQTLEATVVLAGLCLWVDTRDTLASAELARLIAYPDTGNEWLEAIVQKPGREAFAKTMPISAILQAREAAPLCGGLEALDRIIELTRVQELCRRWGDAEQRVANLEALRRHAAEYADRCANEGLGCSPAVLVRRLREMADRETDDRGIARDTAAVTVSTWHGSKGLEWPVTVLFELDDRDADLAAIGVHVESDRATIDLADPLADRWIRYWPYPLGYPRKDLPFRTRLAAHPITARAMVQGDREDLRLLYVGWTRARDRLVLAARPGRVTQGALSRLNVDGRPPISDPPDDATTVDWAGGEVDVVVRKAGPEPPLPLAPVPSAGYEEREACDYPAAFVSPSALQGQGQAGEPIRIGPRLAVHGTPEWDSLGSALHGFLAADRPDRDADQRERLAARLLSNWGVEAIDVGALLDASDRLRQWVDTQWPDARWRRELPIEGRLSSGSIVRGEADLVLETDGGVIVIDHKSFPGTVEQAIDRAESHAAQLEAYATVVSRATDKPVLGAYIHMPVSGVVIPLASVEQNTGTGMLERTHS